MRAGLENNRYDPQRSAASLQNRVDTVQRSSAMVDNRPETALIQQLKKMANNSARNDSTAQLQAGTNSTAASQSNKTGLPAQLKSGVESLSGQSMDDVNVHYNSDKPSQLQAHAFAQGTDIHLASGQEKHLPHEAWHVVQQKQGRVQPTTQLKGKVNINDDPSLEREADVMGAKALSQRVQSEAIGAGVASKSTQLRMVQRAETSDTGKTDESTKSFEATVEQDMLILRGDRSWWGRLTGSQFTKLYDAIENLGTAAPDDKPALIEEIHTLGQTYLDTHVDSDENDKIRRASIERIVAGIGRFKSDSEAAAKALSIASTDDKVGIGAKLKKAIFGADTPFVQAVNAFTEYQNQSSSLQTSESSEGIAFLRGVFEKAKAVKSKVDAWKEKHPSSEERTDDLSDKRGVIQNMVDKLGVINMSLKFKYKNLFKFTGEQVKIDPLKEELNIASIKVKMLEGTPSAFHELEAEAKGITYSDGDFDFSEVSLTKPPEEFSPFPGVKFTSPPSIVLKKSGADYKLEVGVSGIDIKAGNLFQGQAKVSGVFKYNSANPNKVKFLNQLNFSVISVKLLEDVPAPVKNLTASVHNLKIASEGDSFNYDYSKIKLTAKPEEFKPFTGLTLKSPQSVVIRKDSDKYRIKIGNAGIAVDAGGYFNADAYGSAEFSYVIASEGKYKFVQNVYLNDVNGKLGDNFPDAISGLKVKGEGISIKQAGDSYDTDFKKITVSSKPKDFTPFGGPLTVSAPDKAVITGPKADYKVLFTGSKAAAQFGEPEGDGASLKANGSADFYIHKDGKKGIEKATLDAEGKSPTLPGKLPFWPLDFGFDVTFPPVPGVSAGISLQAGGGAYATIGGKITYTGESEKIDFLLNAGLTGNLNASIKLGAGVGHKWIAYVGIFAKATANAVATGTAELEGYFKHKSNTYELQKADLNYKMAANLSGNVSAGAEAKALVFYQKTLFEIKSKEWEIASTKRNGAFNLIDKTEGEAKGGVGLLVNDKESINKKIPADQHGKVEDTLTKLSSSGTDSPEIKKALEIINTLSADGESLSAPAVLAKLSSGIASMIESIDDLDKRLEILMPSRFNLLAKEKKKDILIARQLVSEIRYGHLVNFSQFIMKQDPEVITSLSDFAGSLSKVVEIVKKYK